MFFPPRIEAALTRLWALLPLDGLPAYQAIEQLSYLLVLKLSDHSAGLNGSEQGVFPPLRWEVLLSCSDEQLIGALTQALAWLRTNKQCEPTVFSAARLVCTKVSVLKEALALIDALFDQASSPEWRALLYSALLARAEAETSAWAKHGGRFYTPVHLAHLLCSLVRPQPGEKICDYACGNGRLLASAYSQVARVGCDPDTLHYAADGQPLPLRDWTVTQRAQLAHTTLVGVDIDRSAALHSWVLLSCLGIAQPQITVCDALGEQMNQHKGTCDILVGNPPYGSEIDGASLDPALRRLDTKKAELLFLARALQLLRPGGRAALIVPDGVLFQANKAAVALRRELVRAHCLHAILSLPPGIFAPYTNVKTSIVVLTRSEKTVAPWCYDLAADGYSLDTHRRPQPERTDFPDLSLKYSLHFAESLTSCRPAAFLDDDAELQWNNVEPVRQPYHYAQPVVTMRQLSVHDETVPVPCFQRTLAVPTLTDPKSWEIALTELDSSYILLPKRYQPLSFSFVAKRPGYPPGYPASMPRSGRLERLHAQDGGEPTRAFSFLSLPRKGDLASLGRWYGEGLRTLRALHMQGLLTVREHVHFLRLLYWVFFIMSK